MKLTEDIHPVTHLKSHAADLLQQVNDTRRPIIITHNGLACGVLQDPESYESTKQALAMLKLMVQGEADIQTGRHCDAHETLDRLQVRIEARREPKP